METRKPIPKETQQQYLRLRYEWEMGTWMNSNLDKSTEHPAFQRILELGEDTIPLILADLIQHPSWIVIALRRLHPDGPDRQPQPGVINDIVQAWLEWGARTGMIGNLDQSLQQQAIQEAEPEHENPGPFSVVVQPWIEHERGYGVRPDGASLHLTQADRDAFIADYWARMPDSIPDDYSEPFDTPYIGEITGDTYKKLLASKNGVWENGTVPHKK